MSCEGIPEVGGPAEYRRSRLVVVVAWLTLAYGLYSLVKLPGAIGTSLTRPPISVSVSGESAKLVTFGLSWHHFLYVGWTICAVQYLGLVAAGYALLRTQRRLLEIALVLLIPSVIRDLLTVSGSIALATGQVHIDPSVFLDRPGSPRAVDLYHRVLPWVMGVAVVASLLYALYFLWLWREWKRMAATRGRCP
jgi:hypothetical protein